jgi:hypothetical protein
VRTVQNDDFSQAWPRQIDLSPSFCFRPTGPTTVLIPAHETCSEKEKKRPLSHATILFIRKIKCSKKNQEKRDPMSPTPTRSHAKLPTLGRTVVSARKPRPRPSAPPRLSSAVAARLGRGQRRRLIGPPSRPPLPAARSTISEVPLARPCTATPQPVEVTRGPGSRSCDVAMPQRARAMAFFVNV